MRTLVLAVALTALSSCAAVKRVDGRSVAALPLETRLDLLEAENDLFIAVDTLDDAQTRLGETRDDLKRAKQRLKESEDALEKARETKDAAQVEIATLSIEESKQRRAYLKAFVGVQDALLEVEEANLLVAQAGYEKKRAQAVKAANVAGAEKIDLAAFDGQLKKLTEKAAKVKERAEAKRAESEKLKEGWGETRKALAAKSGGGQGSPWVE